MRTISIGLALCLAACSGSEPTTEATTDEAPAAEAAEPELSNEEIFWDL